MSEPSGRSAIPWLTPEEHAEWQAAYAEELATGPGDEGQVLSRAAERTAHLWGVRIAPDGTVVFNPDRLSPQTYAQMTAAQQDPEAESQQATVGPQGRIGRAHVERQPELLDFTGRAREPEPEAEAW
jgi:hypothetical protein